MRQARCTVLTMAPNTVFVSATCPGIVMSPKAHIVSPENTSLRLLICGSGSFADFSEIQILIPQIQVGD